MQTTRSSRATPKELAEYKYAPITSCDVERSFSCMKSFLTRVAIFPEKCNFSEKTNGGTKRRILQFLARNCGSHDGRKQWRKSDDGAFDPETTASMAAAFNDVQAYRFPDDQITMQDRLRLTAFPYLGVWTLGGGACFYSSFERPLPWVVNNVPPQRYYCFKLR